MSVVSIFNTDEARRKLSDDGWSLDSPLLEFMGGGGGFRDSIRQSPAALLVHRLCRGGKAVALSVDHKPQVSQLPRCMHSTEHYPTCEAIYLVKYSMVFLSGTSSEASDHARKYKIRGSRFSKLCTNII